MNFRRRIFLLISLFIIVTNIQGQWPLRDTVEFQPRDGMPNFFHKIQNGETTKIGFIGGSITKANGWRPLFVDWTKEYYINENVVDINAAVGGTNSMYGVFRMDRELLSKEDYDLIFIEFALNDNPGTSSDVEKSIEGIIRKIWLKNPYTDICFIYTIRNTSLTLIEDGKMTLTVSKHDSIASYYNIPSIFFGVELDKQLESGISVFFDEIANPETSQNASGQYVLTLDNVHPTEYGHQVYTDIVAKSFKSVENNSGTYLHEIKAPLLEDNYVDAKMLPVKEYSNHGMPLIDSKGQKDYLDKFLADDTRFLVSEESDEYYSFSFRGQVLGLNLLIGPASGLYVLEVDGEVDENRAFDGYCSIWRRLPLFVHLSPGEHQVKIYPSANSLSQAEKEDILINEDRKQDLRDNPEEYIGNELIFSDIFISGELTNLITEKKNICTGDSLFWQGSYFSEKGLYYATYQSIDGFDSIRELDLDVLPLPEFTLGSNTILNNDDTLTIAVDNGFSSYLWNDNDTISEKQFIASEMDDGVQSIWLLVTDANQCQNSDTLEITVQTDSSIEGAKNEYQFAVYPNPTTNILHVTSVNLLKEETEISLFTLTGAEIFNKTYQDNRIDVSIDLSDQPAGVYVLRVQSGNSETVVKIVKG